MGVGGKASNGCWGGKGVNSPPRASPDVCCLSLLPVPVPSFPFLPLPSLPMGESSAGDQEQSGSPTETGTFCCQHCFCLPHCYSESGENSIHGESGPKQTGSHPCNASASPWVGERMCPPSCISGSQMAAH